MPGVRQPRRRFTRMVADTGIFFIVVVVISFLWVATLNRFSIGSSSIPGNKRGTTYSAGLRSP